MANRAGKLRGERRALVALAVHLAREAGVPWKRLEVIYDRERRQLQRLAEVGLDLMSQKNCLMSQHGDCCQGQTEGRLGAFSSNLVEVDSMGGSPSPAPIVIPAAPTLSDPAVTNAARQEQLNAARARGRGATIITGGQGTTTAPATQSKVLFGS
jgi:hypothetical protein